MSLGQINVQRVVMACNFHHSIYGGITEGIMEIILSLMKCVLHELYCTCTFTFYPEPPGNKQLLCWIIFLIIFVLSKKTFKTFNGQ